MLPHRLCRRSVSATTRRCSSAGWSLLAADTVVAGVHADLTLTGLDDLGWKAVAANVSDIAAMGGIPRHLLVSVAGPSDTDLDLLYRGISDAAAAWDCVVVGGDLTNAPTLVVTVAITGSLPGPPILRSGAGRGRHMGDRSSRSAAAGLQLLRDRGKGATGAAVDAHRRPEPSVAAGLAAREAGATAMIDISDGLAADLGHLARPLASGWRRTTCRLVPRATLSQALVGGEDYVLLFTAASDSAVLAAFVALPAPVRIGICVADPSVRLVQGLPFPDPGGWEHSWG